MKKISLNLKIIVILLLIYIVTYNFFLNLGINSEIYNILFWLVIFVFSFILLGYTKNKNIVKKTTIQYIIIYCIIYFLLIYFLGIITGFNYSPFSLDLISIIKNIVPVVIIITLKEIVRYILLFKGRFNKYFVIIITIIYTLIDIVTVVSMYELSTGLLIFTFIGEVCIKSIYNNIFQTIVSYNVGPLSSIIYKLLLTCYVYLVPIIPNLGVYLTVVIDSILPVTLLLKLNKVNYNYQNVSKKRVSISKKYITLPIVIFFVIIISLVSGFFQYKIIAIASNSMLPKISRGDAIIYEKIKKADELKEGDILVFTNEGTIYVHRIVEISRKNKEVKIYTKGDNNTIADDFITTEENILGVVRANIKYIGYPTIWLSEML